MTEDDRPVHVTVPRDYTPPADLLAERVILITGAADGIGRALAESAARYGATVILLDKDLPKLEAVYDAIEAAGGPQPALYPMNLEGVGPAEFLELATTIDQEFGRLDVLIHNAAMLGEQSPMHQYDHELWARVLHVNVNAPFLLNQALLGLVQRSDRGRVLFVSDQAGRRGRAFRGAYGVSKFAQEGMMETLAAEMGTKRSVRTMSIDPGVVNTSLRRFCFPGEDWQALPQPADVAPMLLYPLGEEGDSLHGARLSVAHNDATNDTGNRTTP